MFAAILTRRLLVTGMLLVVLACGGGSSSDPAPAPPILPPVTPPTTGAATFKNPLLNSGPDPWVYQKDGFYYYMSTSGGDLRLRKTAKMSEVGSAPEKVIWTPNGSYRDIWAPEIYFFDGKWYVYFSADPMCCGGHRTWVLENSAADPTTGTWTLVGKVATSDDKWAIDGTVLEQNGQRYFIWSGHKDFGGGVENETQRLYIAKMRSPTALAGERVEISQPTYGWEKTGYPFVNEGPEALHHGDKTFIVYSASHCSTDDYALGLLTASSTADPLKPDSWTKTATPVFTKNPANQAYGPGHNGFFKSKDGTQDWIIYHANPMTGQGCSNSRTPRMQPFTWKSDGMPDFGTPVAVGTALPVPSGE
ncbi:glycoside hydrolase family 43 protein [Hymenobacter citatus]|uniref:glycoside hydrolase family 43 protein n=1 Tax=Hymenobacter citatus TaxID=2763506 RepID=UPI001FE443BE|nr:glycoside hydrolase family 43 protein [Hymenobacter citatus]